MRISVILLCASLGFLATGHAADETAADITTRRLLDALDEQQMPDMTLAVLERVTADPTASAELKREVPLRRAGALVGMSKTEGDSKKRAAYLDDAQKSLDEFLASGSFSDTQAISAYSQKGNLLVERGRSKADQANRPGAADAEKLRAEALAFFNEAIKSLKGVTKPGEEIKAVTNAEDAVLKVLRDVSERVQALKARDVKPGPGQKPLANANPAQVARAKAAAAKAAADEANAAQAAAAQATAQAQAAKAAAAAAKGPQAGAAKKVADQAAAAQTAAQTIATQKVAAAQKAAEEAAVAKKAAAEAKDAGPAQPAPERLKPQEVRQLTALTDEMEALQGKLLQTRMTTAAAVFEKARAYPEKSKEWKETVTASAELFKELADKYPSKGAGLLARYYEGRNYALLENWEMAVNTLAPLVSIEQRIPLAVLLRSRALNTTLEAVLATKKYELFDESARKFALEDLKKLPGAKLDADWLGLKYRAAALLNARAETLDEKDSKNKAERGRLQADAKKLATEVALANADFAAEARELAAKLGKVVKEGERTFQAAWADAQTAIGLMQQRLAAEKQAAATKDPAKIEEAKKATAEVRDQALAGIEEAMTLAGLASPLSADISGDMNLQDATIEQINQARYLLTFLLYSAERYEDAAAMARLLAEHYPNARGSRQAATIGMSAWQQAAQRAPDEEARQVARGKASDLAALVMKVWPNDSGDAASIVIGTAVNAREPKAMIAILDQTPANSPQRRDILLRSGSALWREVMEARRNGGATDAAVIEDWKTRARKALDEGLASVASAASLPEGQLGALVVAGALARVQIAMDDDDAATALATLEHAVYGPWPLVAANSPILQQGTLSEAALTLALRLFIQAEKFDQAEQAMDGLDKQAGAGEDAAAKLTAMYFSMSRDLQAQLVQLGAGQPNDPKVRARAEKILGGFEKFLDRVAARDPKISSQFWVATTFLTLGSGQAMGAVVPKEKASRYLQRAADVYAKLLEKVGDPEVARFEPSIRLRMANIYQELRQWDDAQKQIDWILGDAKRQNSLDTQIQAAGLLQSAADDAAKNNEAEKADMLYREAAGGRRGDVKIWGWGEIANKLARQGVSGADEKSRQARDAFFNARYRVAECLLARARIPGKAAEKQKRLTTAETVIAITFKTYPDLGGPDMTAKFDRLAKQVQQELGVANPAGLGAFQAAPAGDPAPAVQQGAAKTP
jgi:hypothetical protein